MVADMTTQRYAIQKISTWPFAKFGCVLGGLVMLFPSIICAVGSVQLVRVLRTLLDKWQSAQTDLVGLGVPVEFDFITLLGLEAVQALLISLDDQAFVLALLIILISVIGGGLVVALIILLLGWSYNLLSAFSGGLEVELREQS